MCGTAASISSIVVVLSFTASAATKTWSGGNIGRTTNWTGGGGVNNASNNWAGRASPVAGDDLVFAGTVGLTNTNNTTANTSYLGITFASDAGAFTIGGNAITLTSGVTNSSTSTQTLNMNLILGATRTFSAASGNLAMGGIISGAGGLTKTGTSSLILSGSNTYTGTTTISEGTLQIGSAGTTGSLSASSAIINNSALFFDRSNTITQGVNFGTISGTGSLTQAGSGTLILSSANTYTGATVITGGTLQLAAGGTLGNGSNLTVASNGGAGSTAILNLNGNNATIGSLTIGGSLTGGPSSHQIQTGAGTLTLGGNVTVDATTTYNTAATTTISGNLALGGATRTFNIEDTNLATDLTVSAGISGTAAGLTKTGAGVLSLTGSNTYTGTTSVNAGILSLGNANALGGGGTVSFGGGTLQYTASNTADLSGRLANLGASSISLDTNGQSVTWASPIGSSQTGGFTKSGSGTLTLSGANAYTGTTSLQGGTLALGNDTALGTSSVVINSATLSASGGTRSINNAVSISGDSTFDTSGQGLTMSGDIVTLGAPGTLTLTGSADGALRGIISEESGNTLDLSKTGSGLWTISGNNSFDGTTSLGAGTLRLENANALGIRQGADTLTLGGGNLQLAGDSATTFGSGSGYGTTLTSDATITLDRLTSGTAITHQIGGLTMGAQTLTLEKGSNVTSGTAKLVIGAGSVFSANPTFNLGSGTELQFGSNITGEGNLTKNGAGILTMNVGSGLADVTVNGGQLNINWFQALGTSGGTLTLASGVTLDNTSAAALTVANPKSITLGADAGASTLNFLGTRSLGMGSGTVSLTANTTFNVSANTLTFGGNLTGDFGITKTGAGTLELAGLSGSGSYSGNTLISEGRLLLSGLSSFKGGTVTVEDGAFLEYGASATAGGATIISRPEGVITNAVVTENITYAASGSLGPSNSNINGRQTINSGFTITAANDFFGTTPATATPSRIVIEDNATIASTASFTIDQRKGIQIGTLTGTAAGSAIFSPSSNTQLLLPSSIDGDASLVKTGAGNIRLIGDNSYRGGTVINQGIIGFFDDASLGLAGTSVSLNGGTIVAASPDASRADSENKTATIGSTRSVILGAGTTNSMDAQTGRVLVYNGVINESSGVANMEFGLAGTRSGVVRLGGLNTYSGKTTVEAGVVEISHLGNGGVASGIGDSSSAAANLILGGPTASGTLRYTGDVAASTDRLFTLGANGGSIDGGTQGITFSNSGDIAFASTGARSLTLTGTGSSSLAAVLGNADASSPTSIVKSGNGTWILGGNNTYTGETTIEAGKLQISSSGNLGTGNVVFSPGSNGILATTANLATGRNVTFTGNGAFETATSTTASLSGVLSGAGGLTKTGAGTLEITGTSNTLSGGITINAGTLKATGLNSLGAGAILNNGALDLSYQSTATAYLLSNTITGSGSLSRNFSGEGTSTVALTGNGNNTFDGLTTVNGGTLRLDKSDGAQAIGGNIQINGGAIVSRASEQIANSSAVTLAGGTFEFAPTIAPGRTETVSSITQTGGTFRTHGNQMVVDTFSIAGSDSITSINGQAGTAGTLRVNSGLSFTGTGDTGISIGDVSASGSKLLLGGGMTSSLSAGTATISGTNGGLIDLDGGTRTFNIGNGSASTDMLISASITNGGLTKTGGGTLQLTGTNTHTGATSVDAGKLVINGTTSAESAISVSSGAILGGSGTIGGDATISTGGVLAPGNSPGVLTVDGTTTLQSGSVFEWELDTSQSNPETNRGVAYDGVNTDSLAGTGVIFKILLTGTQTFSDTFWNQTRTWTDIFKSADGTTTLADWASVFSGGFQYSYNGNTIAPVDGQFTLSGNTLTWSAVPEPSNALAGLLAASALLRRRRRL